MFVIFHDRTQGNENVKYNIIILFTANLSANKKTRCMHSV